MNRSKHGQDWASTEKEIREKLCLFLIRFALISIGKCFCASEGIFLFVPRGWLCLCSWYSAQLCGILTMIWWIYVVVSMSCLHCSFSGGSGCQKMDIWFLSQPSRNVSDNWYYKPHKWFAEMLWGFGTKQKYCQSGISGGKLYLCFAMVSPLFPPFQL